LSQYIIRRIIYFVPVLFAVSLITFLLMRVIPGDPASLALGTSATPESLELYREANGLNEPLFDWKPPFGQYGEWMWGLMKGDFGNSYFHRPRSRQLASCLPVTSS
jgi:peptide/nickel transport system permease protein